MNFKKYLGLVTSVISCAVCFLGNEPGTYADKNNLAAETR